MTDQTTAPASKGTVTSIASRFYALLADIEAIPGEITEEISIAKTRVMQASDRIIAHFMTVGAAAAVIGDVKTEAAKVEGNVVRLEPKLEAAVLAHVDAPAAPASTDAPAAAA